MDKNLVNMNPADFAEGGKKKVGQLPIVPMDLPHKKLSDLAHKTYHVYKDHNEFVEVEAQTASEALEKSGVKNPAKIKRAHVDIGTLIEKKMIVDASTEVAAPAPTAVVPAEATPPQPAPDSAAPATQAP